MATAHVPRHPIHATPPQEGPLDLVRASAPLLRCCWVGSLFRGVWTRHNTALQGSSASAHPTAFAAARPATRREKRQPPRKVPSRALLPCTPPPPNPATSPAAYTPGSGDPSAWSTRASRSVCSPPRVLRVRMFSRTA